MMCVNTLMLPSMLKTKNLTIIKDKPKRDRWLQFCADQLCKWQMRTWKPDDYHINVDVAFSATCLLKIRRKAMKQLFEKEHAQWDKEYGQLGLTFLKDHP